MIKYKKGCVVEAFMSGKYIALLHQANCFNTMNSGVAKKIREELTRAYDADCMTVKGDVTKLGTFSYAAFADLGGFVVNLYGQYNYGKDGKKYTQPINLEKALERFAERFKVSGELGLKVCLPRLGCGLGGADWDTELVPMIERQLISRGFKVHVYDKE
jgi:O-acetyl-ADP-ribose deacetylase (regulator of RNase III)